MIFDNFIFDLDGTIINSSKEVFQCFAMAFESVNYDIDKTRLNPNIIGPPLKEIIKLIAPELDDSNKINLICQNFRQIYDNDENDCSELYDGIFSFLKKLKKHNKKIFMATFKPMIPTIRLVNKFKLNDLFDDIYGIDKFGKHITKEEMIEDIINKYNLNRERTVMIGDAPTDVIAAKNTGIFGIGALWGYGSDKTALKKNSNLCINNIKELDNSCEFGRILK